MRKLVFTTLLFVSGFVCYGQVIKEELFQHAPILSKEKVVVRNILLTGNKLTKKYIVFRELQFVESESYTLADVLNRLQVSQQNLMNTNY